MPSDAKPERVEDGTGPQDQAAEELVAEGAADIAAGASELTEAEMMAGLGGALEEAGEETEEPTD